MKPSVLLCAAAVLAAGCEDPTRPSGDDVALVAHGNTPGAVVRVAPPTGDPATDAANIAAAVAAATEGATIAFARGTYVLAGGTIRVSVPGVTLEGHRRGTTLRGLFHDDPADDFFFPYFELVGGHQRVRHLTFRDMHNPLSIGEPGTPLGGYRVEDCTFRENSAPIVFFGFSDEVSRMTGNRFINVVVPFNIFGKTVHFRENRITSPDPAASPLVGQPFSAGVLLPDPVAGICEHNVLEENTIVGNADGFLLFAFDGETCRNNVIRENTFIRLRVFTPDDNGSMVGLVGPGVERNLVEENELLGSEGLGIVVLAAHDNRIVDNEIRNLPGEKETFTPSPGTAIFLDEATSGNRVKENEFKKVAHTIVDLGTGNIIRDNDDDDRDRDHDDLVAPVLPRSMTRQGVRALDHPKLRFLRDHMMR